MHINCSRYLFLCLLPFSPPPKPVWCRRQEILPYHLFGPTSSKILRNNIPTLTIMNFFVLDLGPLQDIQPLLGASPEDKTGDFHTLLSLKFEQRMDVTLNFFTACVPRDNAQRTDGSLQRALGRSQGNPYHTLVKVVQCSSTC